MYPVDMISRDTGFSFENLSAATIDRDLSNDISKVITGSVDVSLQAAGMGAGSSVYICRLI